MTYKLQPKARIQCSKHCKKRLAGFSCPNWDVTYPNSSWPGIIILFPARKSLVSDILAGDGKTAKLFFTVCNQQLSSQCNSSHFSANFKLNGDVFGILSQTQTCYYFLFLRACCVIVCPHCGML